MFAATAKTTARSPLDPSQAAVRFAAMGITEQDDRSEEDRLLSTVHAGVRVVWRSVRCYGASEAAVAKHLGKGSRTLARHMTPEKVSEYLLRADRAIEAQGEVPSEVAERARSRYLDGFADAMRLCIEEC